MMEPWGFITQNGRSVRFDPSSPYPSKRGIPLETLSGYRLTCSECDRPFRCFRPDEPLCGCCRPVDGRSS